MNWFEKNILMTPDESIPQQMGSEVCDIIAGSTSCSSWVWASATMCAQAKGKPVNLN